MYKIDLIAESAMVEGSVKGIIITHLDVDIMFL